MEFLLFGSSLALTDTGAELAATGRSLHLSPSASASVNWAELWGQCCGALSARGQSACGPPGPSGRDTAGGTRPLWKPAAG